jgi:hypothetical protein
MPITYSIFLEELKKEVGPLAKIFLDRAMDALGITEINDDNYKDVLGVLKMNRKMREFIEIVEKRLDEMK